MREVLSAGVSPQQVQDAQPRRAARATVRSERILPNGPWFVLSLMVAAFRAAGQGVVVAARMAFC